MGYSVSDTPGRPRGIPVIQGEFRRNFFEVIAGLPALETRQQLIPVGLHDVVDRFEPCPKYFRFFRGEAFPQGSAPLHGYGMDRFNPHSFRRGQTVLDPAVLIVDMPGRFTQADGRLDDAFLAPSGMEDVQCALIRGGVSGQDRAQRRLAIVHVACSL